MGESRVTNPLVLRLRLRQYALALPEAWEDHPWGETVAKVRKRGFVFLGSDGSAEPRVWVKLTESQPLALAQPGVSPAGYNWGRSGSVDVRLSGESSFEMLREWIDESYRAVAPRALGDKLAGRPQAQG